MKIKQEGFTLIELLVVVAIIGILAAIAIPQFAEYRKRGFDSRSVADLRNAASAEEAYFVDNEQYHTCASAAVCVTDLPGFKASPGVLLSMTRVPAAGAVPEYFTGMSAHPNGTLTSLGAAGTRYNWDSNAGGLQ